MEMNLKYQAVVGVCALGLVGLNSCLRVDDTYDLDKDIDMTVTVGGNLTIPGSSTEQIKLNDLLDLEEDGVIQADADGNYRLIQNGEEKTTGVEVPAVNVSMTSGFTGVSKTVNVPGRDNPGVSGNTDENVTVTFEDDIDINVTENGITSDIKSIKKAVTRCEETYLVFAMESDIATAKLKNGYKIEFPDYIKVQSMDEAWKGEGNVLELTAPDGMEITERTEVQFQIVEVVFENTDAKFTNNENETDNNSITLRGSVKLDGNITAAANGNEGGDVTIKADVESKALNIINVTAVVDPEVDIKVEPITLNDLPDFLSDNDVVIDLTDPRIYITLTNPSPVSVNLSAELCSYKQGKDEQKVTIPTFNIPANEKEGYTICINQTEGATEEGVDLFIPVDGLSDIIKYIPERIEMNKIVTEVVQEDITVNLGTEYPIVTNYKVDTPLMFGPETAITYNEVIDGWDADLEDMEFERVKATMTVTNAIPLGIELTAVAIDKNGNKLENVDVDLDVKILPGSTDIPTKTNVEFALTTKDGSIKGLDGIDITVKANSSENTDQETLNENQYMQFTDVKLSLEGGITMDLN